MVYEDNSKLYAMVYPDSKSLKFVYGMECEHNLKRASIPPILAPILEISRHSIQVLFLIAHNTSKKI